MIRRYLTAALLWAVLTAISQADDKPKLPEGAPPRLVTVIEVKGDVLVYRDFSFTPLIPKKTGHLNPKELVPAHPSAGSLFAGAVEFSLKEGQVFDAEGKTLTTAAAKKRLAAGDTVLVSSSGKQVDPAYLQIVKKETLILVHPAPPPGPPLPKEVK